MLTEEKKLAILIQQGDKKAFKKAFDIYYAGLVSYGTHLIKNQESSRDLVQEIFLKLWKNRDKLSIQSSLKSYLFSAINNAALNYIRHERITQAFEEQSISTWIYDDQHQIHVNPFLQEALKKAIDKLPPKARQCFTLTQIDGLSIKEAAKSLALADKTVENQLARSRKILQQKLKSYKD